MFAININGKTYNAYESWQEVPLIEFTKIGAEDAYYTLTGLDVPTLVDVLPDPSRLLDAYTAMQAMVLKQWPPLTDIGRRTLKDYIQAKEAIRKGNHYLAVRTYYPAAKDNAYDAGLAWLEFAKAWEAYIKQWAWVDELSFMGPSPNMKSMEKYGALMLAFDLATSVDKLDSVLNLEADVAMTYRAAKLEQSVITHNFQYMRNQVTATRR